MEMTTSRNILAVVEIWRENGHWMHSNQATSESVRDGGWL